MKVGNLHAVKTCGYHEVWARCPNGTDYALGTIHDSTGPVPRPVRLRQEKKKFFVYRCFADTEQYAEDFSGNSIQAMLENIERQLKKNGWMISK